ncbi:MAG: DUF1634 domain-containing protein [Bdellovibrionia bacterium]
MEKTVETKLDRSEALLVTEQWIAFVLRYGVILCALIISFGLVLRVFHLAPVAGNSEQIVRDLTSGIVSKDIPVPRSLSEFLIGLSQASPDVFISLGLLVLIALPILRVSMTVVLFLIERDLIYLGITLFVLSALLTGVFMGKGL